MKKRAHRPRKPNRPGQPGLKLNPMLPRDRLIAAIADAMARKAARTGAGEADPDAELLRLCAIVKPAKINPDTVLADDWELCFLRASSMQALTLPGLRAKLNIAVMTVGFHPELDEDGGNFDRMVLWLMLTEFRALVDDAIAKTDVVGPAEAAARG